MQAESPQKGKSNVVPLDIKRAPNKERLDTMQQWHVDQAAKPAQAVAAIHISITQDGNIRTEGIAVERAHAQAMLAALPRLIEQLNQRAGYAPDRLNVRPMHYAAEHPQAFRRKYAEILESYAGLGKSTSLQDLLHFARAIA